MLDEDGRYPLSLHAISDDGVVSLVSYPIGQSGVRTLALAPAEREPRVLPPGVMLAGTGSEVGSGGWRPARMEAEGRSRPGFLRLDPFDVRLIPGASGWAAPWGHRWGLAEESQVRVVSAGSEVRVPLSPDLSDAAPHRFQAGVLELRESRRPVALVDLDRRRVVRVPPVAVAPGSAEHWSSALRDGFLVALGDGQPRYRVEVATGQAELLNLPHGYEGFYAAYCTPPPGLEAGGRMVLGLRRTEGASGVYREDQKGAFIPLGRPMHGVLFAAVQRVGDTWVLFGRSGAMTFCPLPNPWPDPPAAWALVGDSTQLVGPKGAGTAVPGPYLGLNLDPSGGCALWQTADGRGTQIVQFDVLTGRTVRWVGLSFMTGVSATSLLAS